MTGGGGPVSAADGSGKAFRAALTNTLKSIIGTGVIALPFAVRQGTPQRARPY